MKRRFSHAQKPPHRPKWKERELIKKRQGLKVLVRAGFYLLLALFFLLAIGEIWKNWHQALWDNQRTFYFAVQEGETSWLVKADKNQQEAVVIKIPGHTLINTARGFGEYQAKSIYKMGEIEKISGIDLVKESLTWTFGIPVEGVLKFDQETKNLDLKTAFFKASLGWGKTNLTKWDLWRLFLFFNKLRLDQVETVTINDVPGVETKLRLDGVTVLSLDTERLDNWLLSRFTSSEMVNEPYSWEVMNTTMNSGLAAQVARLLRNTGVQVVQVNEGSAQESKIYVDNKVNSQAVRFFSRFLKIPISLSQPDRSSQGEITVVLGNDFWCSCCQY
ncbi:hypothetical protein A2160_05905 [Candidatus Beckwithbacteria bacterium RBG_13_42_9]|uniref:LytR/CpsA/Psr regulator C-terminal domain-containing protein n=1 Tax=Candidatus Beckwithbacteria bacterium RBG_13_42_9 TaxID=1797457 RepID=A0A1F5E581_9BACT|nr:MAG: hypothetical protein A2160_05905 [Candidatus Beckwithbacteria bacterium RBG_13_42_9]